MHQVRWGDGVVYVPLWSLAIQWLILYWPLLTVSTCIAQARGEKPKTERPLKFRRVISDLAAEHGSAGLYDILCQIDEHPQRFQASLKVIANTIRSGPVTYAGTYERVFEYTSDAGSVTAHAGIEGIFGWVVVPEPLWLDISRFDHWIEDSIVIRWAQLTADMNPDERDGMSRYVPLLLERPGADRKTGTARALIQASTGPLECVWSGQRITCSFDIDHVIPYTVWGNNDLWNMLPALPQINTAKRASLPTRALLIRRQDCVVTYWQQYAVAAPQHVAVQIERSLGCRVVQPDWEGRAIAGLHETMERLATTRGLPRWEP